MHPGLIKRHGANHTINLAESDMWRVCLVDRALGLLVLDVRATNEADAKGVAHTAATDHLGAERIAQESLTAMRWTEMPDLWKRYEAEYTVQ